MTTEMINMDVWTASNINRNNIPAFLLGISESVFEPERQKLSQYGSFQYTINLYGSEDIRSKDIDSGNPIQQIHELLRDYPWQKPAARYSTQTYDVKPVDWKFSHIPLHGHTSTQTNKPAIDYLLDLTDFDPLNITRQLKNMKRIKDGWADGMQIFDDWGDGFGTAPSHIGLDWLVDQFALNYTDDLPKPHLYPMPDGGIQAEWSIGSYELSLEIDLTSHIAEWYSLNLQTDSDHEIRIDLNRADSWSWITNEIRRLGHEIK